MYQIYNVIFYYKISIFKIPKFPGNFEKRKKILNPFFLYIIYSSIDKYIIQTIIKDIITHT